MRLLPLLLLLPLTSGFFLPPAPARTFSLSANTVLNFVGSPPPGKLTPPGTPPAFRPAEEPPLPSDPRR
jgi:hypothetical protein